MRRATLDALLAARREKRAVALVTEVGTGREALLGADATQAPEGFGPGALDAVREAFRLDRSRLVEIDGARCFVHVYNPPLRMFVIGAVHIAQSLAPMAALAGYDVTVVDPRRSFASDARFPGVHVLGDWPDEALEAARLDRRSAVVTLTHDPKLDDPALEAALRSEAFYVGSLGSKRTHAARVERLRGAGLDEAAIARIHAPVGLDIGAVSPAEIAAAIVAEVTLALRGTRR